MTQFRMLFPATSDIKTSVDPRFLKLCYNVKMKFKAFFQKGTIVVTSPQLSKISEEIPFEAKSKNYNHKLGRFKFFRWTKHFVIGGRSNKEFIKKNILQNKERSVESSKDN